jgi:hypothetical protein
MLYRTEHRTRRTAMMDHDWTDDSVNWKLCTRCRLDWLTYIERFDRPPCRPDRFAVEATVIVDNTGKIHTAQHCTQCGIGPFFYVAGRKHPELCLDCAEAAQ